MRDTRNRESVLRRKLARNGLRLVKTPSRHWSREYYGPGYMILYGNNVLLGGTQRAYEAKLAEVEAYVARQLV